MAGNGCSGKMWVCWNREMSNRLGVGVGCEWSVVLGKEKDEEERGKMGEPTTVGNG